MQDEEIRQKVASFPRWHYQFDLRGNLTPIHKKPRVNRHTQRKKHFFDPLVRLFGRHRWPEIAQHPKRLTFEVIQARISRLPRDYISKPWRSICSRICVSTKV